jgi:hypothetical protein
MMPSVRTPQQDGFAAPPREEMVGEGDILIVYRAHGETSKMIGRFFFTPQIGGTPRLNWTAEMLERELNASLWGNDYQHLAKFQVRNGVKYKIGKIAHDNYTGIELHRNENGKVVEVPFDQYAYFRNANLFYQVQIDMDGDWRTYLELLEDVPLNPGNLVSRAGRC